MTQSSLWDGDACHAMRHASPSEDDRRAARLQRAIRAYGVDPDMLRRVADGTIREETVWGIHGQALTPELNGLRRLVAALFRPAPQRRIRTADDVAFWLMIETAGAVQEELWTVALSTKHAVLGITRMYQGTLNAATVRVGEILRPALAANAHALIVAHNHPSGDPTPSLEDRRLMCQIGDASALHDCELLDFLILGQGRWVSMYEQSGKSKRWWDE